MPYPGGGCGAPGRYLDVEITLVHGGGMVMRDHGPRHVAHTGTDGRTTRNDHPAPGTRTTSPRTRPRGSQHADATRRAGHPGEPGGEHDRHHRRLRQARRLRHPAASDPLDAFDALGALDKKHRTPLTSRETFRPHREIRPNTGRRLRPFTADRKCAPRSPTTARDSHGTNSFSWIFRTISNPWGQMPPTAHHPNGPPQEAPSHI